MCPVAADGDARGDAWPAPLGSGNAAERGRDVLSLDENVLRITAAPILDQVKFQSGRTLPTALVK
jgi:hypothetical protein